MDKFEQWFINQDFYTNMRFDALFIKDGDVYRVLPVQMAWVAWRSRQAEIDRLEEWNSNQARSIKTYQDEDEDLKALLQKLIDDEYTTMRPSMAYEIQKALRGERE